MGTLSSAVSARCLQRLFGDQALLLLLSFSTLNLILGLIEVEDSRFRLLLVSKVCVLPFLNSG